MLDGAEPLAGMNEYANSLPYIQEHGGRFLLVKDEALKLGPHFLADKITHHPVGVLRLSSSSQLKNNMNRLHASLGCTCPCDR